MISADSTGDLNVEFPRNDSTALDLGLCIVSNGLLLCASVSLSIKGVCWVTALSKRNPLWGHKLVSMFYF